MVGWISSSIYQLIISTVNGNYRWLLTVVSFVLDSDKNPDLMKQLVVLVVIAMCVHNFFTNWFYETIYFYYVFLVYENKNITSVNAATYTLIHLHIVFWAAHFSFKSHFLSFSNNWSNSIPLTKEGLPFQNNNNNKYINGPKSHSKIL